MGWPCIPEPMDLIVVGAGRVGSRFLELATEAGHEIVVIERDEETADEVGALHDCLVLQGDGAARDILDDAGLEKADALFATTDSDATNILTMMHGRDAGVPELFSSVNDVDNLRLFRELSVTVVESPHRLAGEYLYHAVQRPAIKDFMDLRGDAAVFEVEVADDAPIVGCSLEQARDDEILSQDVIVVAVDRGDELIVPRGVTFIESGDILTVFSLTGADDETLEVFGADSPVPP